MRKLFNLFLRIAVPVVTGFRFHVIGIGGENIAIIGNRTGLPAVWGQDSIHKHWWDTEYLTEGEDETEIIAYRLDEEAKNA